MTRSKSTIAFSALMRGVPVNLPGHPMPIVYKAAGQEVNFPSQSGELVQDAILYQMEDGRHLGCEISLADFVHEANKLSDEQIVGLSASAVLRAGIRPRHLTQDDSDLAPEGASQDGDPSFDSGHGAR